MRFGSCVIPFEFAGIPIVGNINTGSIIGLTPEGFAICQKLATDDVPESEIIAVDKNLFTHLKRGGFFESLDPPQDINSAYLHVTQRCNLECAGCYSEDSLRNTMADASYEQFTHVIDELSNGGVKRLVISGGEPFLRDDLADIVVYAKNNAGIMSVNVLSNGTCVDSAQLTKMAGAVDFVSVSLDGYSGECPAYIRGEQRFNKLMDAIAMIKDAGIPAHIIPTVHAKNIDDVEEYVKLAKNLGVTMNFSVLSCESDFGPLADLIFNEEQLKHLGEMVMAAGEKGEASLRDTPMSTNLTIKKACGAGSKTISVGADGTVYPCHMMHRRELSMGNLFTDSINEVVTSKMHEVFAGLNATTFERCGSCEYVLICGGGCRARALYSSGDLRTYDSYCTMISTFYDALANKLKAGIG